MTSQPYSGFYHLRTGQMTPVSRELRYIRVDIETTKHAHSPMELTPWNSVVDAMEQNLEAYIGHTNLLNVGTPGPHSTRHPNRGEETATEQGLISIDSKLSRLAGIEEKLRAARVRLQGIRNTSVTLAPINRLPADVLTMIVVAGHEDGRIEEEMRKTGENEFTIFDPPDDTSETEDAGAYHFPTTFSHVCRRWRDIALSVATVWSHIALGPGHSCERAAEWVKRSKQARLALEMSSEMASYTVDFRHALDIIGSNALRTTSLVLTTGHAEHLLMGLEHFSAYNRSPPLKQLRLSPAVPIGLIGARVFGEAEWEGFMKMLEGLEHIHFCRVFVSLTSPAYRGLKTLHLEHLTFYYEHGEQPRDNGFLAMFQESPELESVTLIRVEPPLHGHEIRAEPSIVILQKLKTFSICGMTLQLTCFLLSVLSTPALEEFALSDHVMGNSQPQPFDDQFPNVLFAFLKNVRPTSLKYFYIHDTSTLHLDEILTYTPELKYLYVGEERADGSFGLDAMLGPKYLLPKLERLWLKSCIIPVPHLKELVLQRNNPGSMSPIRHLVVEFCQLCDMDSTIVPILEEKVKELVWENNFEMASSEE